jgi:hypothetical protein
MSPDANRGARPVARKAAALLLVPSAGVVAAALVALRLHFQPPAVPRYDLTLVGTPYGADPANEVPLTRGGRLEIELRPEAAITGAVGARGFLLRGDEVRAWDPPFSVAIDGVVRIAGPVDELFAGVPQGTWEVAVAVGRPEVLPTAPRDVLRRRSDDPVRAGWHLVHARVRLSE